MKEEKVHCSACEKHLSPKNDKKDLEKRLKRIEGQIKGIEKMISEDRYCMDILVQISAAKAAIDKVGKIILENHIKGCIKESFEKDNADDTDIMIEELMKNIYRFMK